MTERWAVVPRSASDREVVVEVDGTPVHVWCDDLPLHDVPEAWGTAFSLPAARAGATLVIDQQVDHRWLDGVGANVRQCAAWWGGSPEVDLDVPLRSRLDRWLARNLPPTYGPPGDGTALCFTGGADSFFSLLTGSIRPTHLLFVVGYDVPLDDAERAAAVVGALHEVAASTGAAPVVVRTDLRTHPRFAEISWEHSHGAALAAVGHLLHQRIGTLVIPPSYAATRLVPWGSRPDLDVRWSVPGRLQVVHGDASGRRVDRVLAIAEEPLAQRHLRVCWQNVAGTLNCGRCEKCVRTMVMLAGAGTLDAFATFPPAAELPAAIAALPSLSAGLRPMWDDLLDLPLDAPVADALRALLDRSEPVPG